MLLPSIFGDNLFDDFMDDMFPAPARKTYRQLPSIMRTDIKETDDSYVLDVELPGFKKEDVKLQLKDGYLNISAATQSTDEEKDDNGYVFNYTFTELKDDKFMEYISEVDKRAFYKTGVDIQPGDSLYVAPENRVKVW